MSRTKVDWRSCSKENYDGFCKLHPSSTLSQDQWRNIIYSFNESFREYILETGEKAKLPSGFGEFAIIKRKRQRIRIVDGKEFINLPIDWIKTRAMGKTIYNFNYHTEGYYFGWKWFKMTAMFKQSNLWYFKPCRNTSRLLAHYLKTDNQYQHLYQEWQR